MVSKWLPNSSFTRVSQTFCLIIMQYNKVIKNRDVGIGGREGGGNGQLPPTGASNMATTFPHVSGSLKWPCVLWKRNGCADQVSPVRSWKRERNKEVGAGAEEGGVRGEGLLVPSHLCCSSVPSLDVKSYLRYFASNNHAPLRFWDGIWVWWTQRAVPLFLLHLCRGAAG